MGKSYTFHDPVTVGQANPANCQLTNSYDPQGKSHYDVPNDVINPDVYVLPPGVKPGEKGDPFRAYRIAKQISMVLVWISLGMMSEIVGPTIPDLTERLCVNYEDISRALVGKSIGTIIGAIIGGFAHQIFHKQVDLWISLSLFCMAAACAALPQVNSLGFVFGMFMINGIGSGIVSTGGNPLIMQLWGDYAAPHLHTLHFGYGLGALIAPQIARPFLSPDTSDDDNYTVCEEVNGTITESESRIEIAYGIVAICVFVVAFLVLGFYFWGPPAGFPIQIPDKSLKKLLSPATCFNGYTVYGVGILTLLFLYYVQAVGGERAYGKFLFSFAIEADVGFTKDEASYLQSAFWASFTLGRLVGAPTAKFINVNYMIIGNITGALITAIVLAIWGATVSTVLWVFTCFMGIFIALFYPNGMCWSNIHFDVNSMVCMLVSIAGGCGGAIYQSLTGSLFENVGPETLMYIMVVYALALAIVYALMQTTVYCHMRHLVSNMEDTLDVDSIDEKVAESTLD